MFYILHGEDEFGLSEALGKLRARLAASDPAMADLNTSILDGGRLALGELRHACDTIPFMADRRLVIVNGLLGRLAAGLKPPDRAMLDDLGAYLPSLPPTTRLVFVETRALKPSHPILKLAGEQRKHKKAYVKAFSVPKEGELPGWIRRKAEEKGGKISNEAVAMLATLVGADLRLLDQEIEKLLLYADGRLVTSEDVGKLVSRAREASIFDLVDCVGRRQTDRALRLLHRMLEDGEAPLYLLAMLARQIRILIQVSELQTQRLDPREMAGRLKLHPYVVQKGLSQARNFDMPQLEEAHRRLVKADWMIKTGEIEDVLALDMLVVALTNA